MTAANETPAPTSAKSVKSKRPLPSPEAVGRRLALLELLLMPLVLVLAFLLGSFAARNSDLWMHLATGRLLAQGGYSLGVDPFSYTSTSAWINHSWLFDLLLYGLSTAAGGIEQPAAGMVLVGFKAFLVLALAWTLLHIRRPGLTRWLAIFCTLLALLAMSHSLELHPRVVSLLFLGITLYCLVRSRTVAFVERLPRERGGRHALIVSPSPPIILWLLPPLVALWANLDSWFLLGPFTVGLFLLGEGFQQAFDPGRFGDDKPQMGELRRLFHVFLACLGAGLLNPHHLYGFALPAEWAWGTLDAVRQADPYFWKSYSPWDLGTYFQPGAPGRTVAGVAYYLLILLSIVSFLLNQQGWRWSRAFLSIAFVLLSIKQPTLIGFSAVVLAPLTALNLQDFAVRRFGAVPFTDPNGRAWSVGGRFFTLLLGLVLLAGAWPGWLHGAPTELRHERRVAWRVAIDPSLRETAQQLAVWRTEGLWTDEQHGFLFHPDVAHYCAWFAPREKGFFDHRYPLFKDTAAEFMKVRQALRGPAGKPTVTDLPGKSTVADMRRQQQALDSVYEDIFRQRGITHAVLYLNETEQQPRVEDEQRASISFRVTQWLLAQPSRWVLRHLSGRTLVFAWNDPPRTVPADLTSVGAVDLNRQAFGRDLADNEKAPLAGPTRFARRPTPWERYLYGTPPTPTGMVEAVRYREYFDLVGETWPRPYLAAEQFSLLTAAAWSAGSGGGCVLTAAALANLYQVPFQFRLGDNSRGPAAALILAVRAARRAILANPDSPEAYLELGRAYELLWRQQEQSGGQLTAPVPRQFQLLFALRQAAALRPEQESYQIMLGSLYRQLGHFDLALDYLREGLSLIRKAGPRPPVTREEFEQRLAAEEKGLQQMEAELQKRRNDYAVAASGRNVLDKAQLAEQRQLIKEALHVLMTADPKEMGRGEVELLLQLLFATGQLEEVQTVLNPQHKAALGIQYERHQTLLAACLGNYADAAERLDAAIAEVSKVRRDAIGDALQALTFGARLHEQRFGWITQSAVLWEARRQAEAQRAFKLLTLFQGPQRYNAALFQEAELCHLRGLLALEQGDTDAAERHFRQAVTLAGGGRLFEGQPVARRYLQLLESSRR